MVLAQPPGARSCRKPDGSDGEGGAWTHCCGEGANHIFIDLRNTLDSTGMGESDSRLYRAELLRKMKLAEVGQLAYGSDAKRHDIFELERSRNTLLELRHDDVTTVDDTGALTERHARLYFTERAARLGELLSVGFFVKAPGPIGLGEQDGHIDTSLARLMSHETSGR